MFFGILLGFSRDSADQVDPCELSVLSSAGEVVRYVACGEEHTLFLTEVREGRGREKVDG